MLYAISPVPQGSESGSARVFKGSPVPAAKGSLGQIHFGLFPQSSTILCDRSLGGQKVL